MRKPGNVMVTGGCGFIGSALIRHLFRQPSFDGRLVNLDALTYAGNPDNVAEVAADPRYLLVHGDITDGDLVDRVIRDEEIATIIHCAAESHVDRSIVAPGAFIQTNIVGTYALLEAVRKSPHVHFHHVSTDEVYGSLPETGRFLETSPYQPNSPYAASKAGSDHLVRAYAHTFGLSVTLSNCSNNYGPYQFPEKLLPLMILNMLERKELPVYGDGGNVRDWLYVDDHAEALWLVVMSGERGATYNVGGDSERRNIDLLHDLIDVVAELTERNAEELRALIRFVADRPGHDRRYAIDATKIRTDLGFSPRHDLPSGLVATVKWYLDNGAWVERAKSGAYRDWIQENYVGR